MNPGNCRGEGIGGEHHVLEPMDIILGDVHGAICVPIELRNGEFSILNSRYFSFNSAFDLSAKAVSVSWKSSSKSLIDARRGAIDTKQKGSKSPRVCKIVSRPHFLYHL